jgi:uncharacterized protein affecting Mg2+/Co2+ transport
LTALHALYPIITLRRAQNIKVMGRGWTIRNDRGESVGQVQLDANAVVGRCRQNHAHLHGPPSIIAPFAPLICDMTVAVLDARTGTGVYADACYCLTRLLECPHTGQQPVIPPNSTWEYYSGTDMDTVYGLMQGSLKVKGVRDWGRGLMAHSR